MSGWLPEDSRLQLLPAQLETVFEGAPLGVGLFDRRLRHVRVNPLLAELNGLPVEQLLGRAPSEVQGEVGRQGEQLYRSVLKSGRPVRDVALSGEIVGRPGVRRAWRLSCFPVRTAGRVAGVCVLVEDVTEQQRLADALAESEERHRRLADDLQRSLLPPVLPRLAGAELASVYWPAAAGASVGGDFYDIIRLSPSSWALVIGDVQGKGPVAASWTAAVRYTIRAAVVDDPDPAHVLRTVNEVLLREASEESLCTVAYVLAERNDARVALQAASAGHPLPLVVRASGAVEPVGSYGTLLGTVSELELTVASTSLTSGDALVLHTDGATEARYAVEGGHVELFGERRLHAALRATAGSNAAAIAARLETAVMDFQAGQAADDLALLVLRATDDVLRAEAAISPA